MIEIIGFLVHLYSDLHFDLESHGHMLFTMSDYLGAQYLGTDHLNI